ncbi:hypothetical protein DL96DRAFT_519378 [Flagelloscypha sp. PMI_526]|nr:hypothetical protein DL96DRAFT_519378 [Flagelloscypha sp. PMI_526]
MLESMFSPTSSPRLFRARAYVTSILTDPLYFSVGDILRSVIRDCVNLRTLSCRCFPTCADSITPPSALRTLGATCDLAVMDFSPKSASKLRPLYRGITHLVIEVNDCGTASIHNSNLTHVYAGCRPSIAPPWTSPLPSNLQLYLVYLLSSYFQKSGGFQTTLSQSRYADLQHSRRIDKRFVLVVPYSDSTWLGRETCGGSLVAPKSWEDESIPEELRRKLLYDWLEEEGWSEGENIVNERVNW